eukprot:m.61419 g.61419  ORF g.61419 m.61419 type:complete len:101 (-) comp22978_c1_seq1:36-338(-)
MDSFATEFENESMQGSIQEESVQLFGLLFVSQVLILGFVYSWYSKVIMQHLCHCRERTISTASAASSDSECLPLSPNPVTPAAIVETLSTRRRRYGAGVC